MKCIHLLWAALGLAGLASAAHADTWTAKDQWGADYGDDYCHLQRFFTNGKDQIALMLERNQPGPMVRIVLIGDGVKTYRSANQLTFNFMPQGNERKAMFAKSKTGDGQQYLDLGPTTLAPMAPFPPPGSPPPEFKPFDGKAEQATAKSITGIAITEGLVEPVTIETGPLDAPIAALQACTADLIKFWGVDPKKHETMKMPVMPDGKPSDWLPSGTYPFSEFAKFTGGLNTIRLMVDETGKPTKCVVDRPSAGKSFNDAACTALMKNAKFKPAQDADGQPMASYWVTEVFGLMPPMRGGRR